MSSSDRGGLELRLLVGLLLKLLFLLLLLLLLPLAFFLLLLTGVTLLSSFLLRPLAGRAASLIISEGSGAASLIIWSTLKGGPGGLD